MLDRRGSEGGGVVDSVVLVVGGGIVIVGNVIVCNVVVDEVVDNELADDDELATELEVGDNLVVADTVVVDPACAGIPFAAVTGLLRSTAVTSGRSTPLVAGIVLDSSGMVDDGNTSVRVVPSGLTS